MSAKDLREYNDEVQWYHNEVKDQAKRAGVYPGWWDRWGKRCVLGFLAGAFLRDMF